MTRRRLAALGLVLVAVVAAAPALEARVIWHGGVYVGVAPFWWTPYPYGWYPGPYSYYPPVVIVEPPPVYVELPQDWYYCAPTQTYYPYVQTCTEPWIKVRASRE
jgi:hypothetical protein